MYKEEAVNVGNFLRKLQFWEQDCGCVPTDIQLSEKVAHIYCLCASVLNSPGTNALAVGTPNDSRVHKTETGFKL